LSARSHGAKARERSSTLDARALEAVARFVRVLARAGCAPQDIGREVQKACRTVPLSWRRHARAELPAIDAAAHALTIWHSDPEYSDARGKPRALSLQDRGLSLETLLRRVDPQLRLSRVLPHLLRTRALRRVGKRFLPNDRALSFRGFGDPYHSRGVRGLLAMLRTLEHNSNPDRKVPGWFEMFALNSRFPVSARPAFDDRLRRQARQFLFRLDADMERQERTRRKGERTVPLGVGVYLFEEAPLRSPRAARKRPRGARR
jgi:Family of unknown function (DUF6502)